MSDAERLGPGEHLPPWIWAEHVARFRFAASMVAGKRGVECACGSGLGTKNLAEAGALAIRAYDVSDAAGSLAWRDASHDTIALKAADGRDLPCPSAWADIYVALKTIEHVHDEEAFLREAVRVLRPGDTFLCSTPNRRVSTPERGPSDKPVNSFHVREYSESEFVTLSGRHFDALTLYGQNSRRRRRMKGPSALARGVSPRVAERASGALDHVRYLRGGTQPAR
ncbi:MAG: class I SAM-dependent methyltransferase [Actinomycetes bacterium]